MQVNLNITLSGIVVVVRTKKWSGKEMYLGGRYRSVDI